MRRVPELWDRRARGGGGPEREMAGQSRVGDTVKQKINGHEPQIYQLLDLRVRRTLCNMPPRPTNNRTLEDSHTRVAVCAVWLSAVDAP